MSERTPKTTIVNGAGKPRLIIATDPFYRSSDPCVYSGNGVVLAGSPTLCPPLAPGQRLTAYREVNAAPPKPTFGRITEIDEVNGRIAIDGWTNGIPACIPAPPSAEPGGDGEVDPGSRRYAVSYIVDGNETQIGIPSDAVAIEGSPRAILLTGIPVRGQGINGACTARKVYRTKAGGSVWYLAGLIDDNSTTRWTDTITDANLGDEPPGGTVPGFVVDGWIADLPRCQEMIETFEPYTLIHRLHRGTVRAKFFGWQYHISLDYSKFLSADAIQDLRRQLHASPDGRLILLPRRDAPQFQYNVYCDEPLNIARYGKSPGYRNVLLHFAGAELVSSLPFAAGYGCGFSQLYGEQF